MAYKAVIDPGHGPGNVNHGPTGYYEFEGMWKLSNYLKTALERCGFETLLTRAEHEQAELEARGRLSEGCDLFISEHTNASGHESRGKARGVEVFYSVQLPEDQALAGAISKAVSELMDNPDRGPKTRESESEQGIDYYGVIRSARAAGCPHVLLAESGFHDNAEDEAFLNRDENLRAIAETQAKVICDFFELEYIQS